MAYSGDTAERNWIPELDGWRATSVILVLLGHLIPLGPKAWELNYVAAAAGMGMFFILSGFLITTFLLNRPQPWNFLIRRGARVVPLAWAYMAIALALHGSTSTDSVARHFLFAANLPPFGLVGSTGHLWSLCLEMQFYVSVALLVALLGRRGLLLLPFLCVAVTWLRVVSEVPISIVTWFRADEILAGACLALLHHAGMLRRVKGALSAWLLLPLAVLYLACAHPDTGALAYLRPYAAAGLIGASLCTTPGMVLQVLRSRPLRHVALISYALYVWHPLLAESWLGTGDGLMKYYKRPLLFAALWALAYASTVHFEAFWTNLGKRFTQRRTREAGASRPTPGHPATTERRPRVL